MLKKLFVLSMLCIFGLSHAQYVGDSELSINVGAPYRVIDAHWKGYYFVDGHMVALKKQKKALMIQTYDLNRLTQKTVNAMALPKNAVYESNILFGNKLYVMYSVYNRSNESEQLYAREVNTATGRWTGAPKRLIATRGKVTGANIQTAMGFSRKVVDKFDFYHSADSTKLVVQYRRAPEVRNDAKSFDLIGMYVFDTDFNEIWGDEVKMPYTEKKMDIMDFSVNSEGTAYILAKVYSDNTTKNKKSRDSEDPNYHIELIVKDADSRTLAQSEIHLENMFIRGVWLYESPTHEMILAGFYNKQDRANADGVFYAKLDADGELDQIETFAIPDEILNQNEHKKTVKKNDKRADKGVNNAFANLRLRKIIFDADGSVTIVGEQYYVVAHTHTDANGNTYTSYTYYYNDLLVTRINPEGEMEWMRKLAKSQTGSSSVGSMGFKHHADKDYYYFFYLDHEENKNLPDDEAPRFYRDGSAGHLVAYTIEKETGLVNKEYLIEMLDVKGVRLYQFAPTKIIQVSPTEFVFEAYKKKKEDVLVKFTFEDK